MGKKSRMATRVARQRVAARSATVQAASEPLEVAPEPVAVAPDPVPALRDQLDRWDALAAVQKTAQSERMVRVRLDRSVIAARRQGVTWVELGQALGVSPQAVQKRYGARVADLDG